MWLTSKDLKRSSPPPINSSISIALRRVALSAVTGEARPVIERKKIQTIIEKSMHHCLSI